MCGRKILIFCKLCQMVATAQKFSNLETLKMSWFPVLCQWPVPESCASGPKGLPSKISFLE